MNTDEDLAKIYAHAAGYPTEGSMRGIRAIAAAIRQEMYPAATSWNGYNVYGDVESIKEVTEMIHYCSARGRQSEPKRLR